MEEDEIAYAEVFEILSYMNRKAVMKIPIEILQYIKDNRNIEYISRIDKNNIFNKENILKKSRLILAWLDLEYLTSGKNKEEKVKMYKDNERKYQMKLSQKYDYNQLFKNEPVESFENANKLIIVEKENIFNKILNFIKKIFNR